MKNLAPLLIFMAALSAAGQQVAGTGATGPLGSLVGYNAAGPNWLYVPVDSQGNLMVDCVSGCSGGGGGGGDATQVTYTQGASGSVQTTVAAWLQRAISVKDFGAIGNGASMAADTAGLKAAVAAATATGKSVYVPAGNYLLDNSSGAVLSGANNVLIWGEGPASSLACQTVGGADCLQSTGATGFALMNLSISFGPTATTRSSGYPLNVETCTNCYFQGLFFNNGDLSGIRLASSVHTTFVDITISNFFANGMFTLNNQDLRVDNLGCSNNQDACFETSWYDSEYSAHSIPCQDITATNIVSQTDTEAILVNSCNNVTVNGWTARTSGKETVFVGQDSSTTTTHWPDRVTITNGSIYGSGYGTNANNTATAQALYVNVVTNPSGFVSHILFSNISATHVSGWGLQMAELQNDDVQLSNVSFYDVGNGNTSGCLQTEGNNVSLNNVTCSDIGTYGLYDTNTLSLTGSGLNFVASSQVSGTQSIYLSATATGFVGINGVNVYDNNASVYSSSIFDGSSSGVHNIYNIVSRGVLTAIGPTSQNSGTSYTYADPTHSLVIRNGGTILSFAPPNVYLEPTAGTTSSSQVNGAVFYWQSKCRITPTGAENIESIGWYDFYPTLTTESFALNQTGGCGFPLVVDVSAAATFNANAITMQSINNVAITAPASLATFTILSGQTFTVNKTMTLTCTTCGTYNLDSFSGGSVSSVFGRVGAVVAASGDYTVSQVTGAAPSSGATLISATINGITPTALSTGFSLAGGTTSKTATFSNSITFAGTDSTTMTFPSVSATLPGLAIANTFSAANIFSAAGAASTPGLKVSGAPYTGGSASTNFPQLYVDAGASEPTTFSTSGTMFGANAPASFGGHFLNFFVNGASTRFRVDSAGDVFMAGTATVTSSASAASYLTASNCSSSASPAVCSSAAAGSVVVAASATTVVVDTTAVTANSLIHLTFDSSLGSKLSVTCNTAIVEPTVSARTAGTSFTITLPSAPSTNPACIAYSIVN